MKLRLFVSLLAAAVLLSFVACRDPGTGAYKMNTKADLTGLTIANKKLEYSSTSSQNQIPVPIAKEDWDDEENFELSSLPATSFKTITFDRDSDIVDVQIKPKASKNARVQWGIGDFINRPATFTDYRVKTTLRAEDYLYLKVTSEDTNATQYYRFYIRVFNAVTHLAEVQIDPKMQDVPGEDEQKYVGKSVAAKGGGAEWKQAEIGDIALTEVQAPNTVLKAIGFDQTSTFRYAIVAAASDGTAREDVAPTNYQALATGPAIGGTALKDHITRHFNDQDMLYIQVTAQNTVDHAFYRFKISVGRITGIDAMTLRNLPVVGIGFSDPVWADVKMGSFEDADQPGTGYVVGITKEDPACSIEYTKIADTAKASAPATYTNTYPANGTNSTAPIKVDNHDILVFKVTSSSGKAVAYYKVQITLLAARFLLHPESKQYYWWTGTTQNVNTYPITDKAERDVLSSNIVTDADGNQISNNPFTSDNPVALSAKLDRSVSGTYQWYEANSWYGGYGFDMNGYQSYLGGEDGKTQIIESGFASSSTDPDYHPYFVAQLDEKANASLFNGGNQEPAHYIVPGRKLEDHPHYGTGYTNASGSFTGDTVPGPVPKIDFRPFLAGGTSEAHYYWVVVKDASGYEATSARAVIVSERNKAREHFIIDVNNYFKPGYDPRTDGSSKTADECLANRISFKNPTPFVKKFDKYKIPLYLPQKFGWNDDDKQILKYTTLTAQATFFLVDGSPFIQNWTQGNLSFENNLDPETNEITDAQNIVVLYYNLTNQNAQIGLDGDSKEPQGADLREIPTHIVSEPSGNFDTQYYPPLRATNTTENTYNVNNKNPVISKNDIPGGTLQGWFCGFIDLVEVRMEGPARQPK